MNNHSGRILSGRGTYCSRLLPPYIACALSNTIISEQSLNFVDRYIIQSHVNSTFAAGPALGICPVIGSARRTA